MTLAHRTYSAGRWTAASTVIRASLQLVQVVVLARFLSPADYGLMAMVTVVLSYATLFSDLGLSAAFVQCQKITHEERSSLFWLGVVVGGALMLLVMAISPLVALFFKEPQLMLLLLLVSTNFLVIAMGQQLRMDAEKSLNFRPVAIIEISAGLLGLVVSVLSAWYGLGVYALVVAAMVNAWLTTLLSWVALAQGWRPDWRLRWVDVRWFVKFGSTMVLNNFINHFNATVDLILGGRALGASQLGLYGVPRNLILQVQGMINPIFTRVGFPLIASIQQDKERVKQVYLRTMNLTASVNAPIYVLIGVFAPEVVWLLLGPNWMEAAQLMRVLAIWGLWRSFSNPVGSLLFGLGYVSLATKWNATLLTIIPPVVWFGSQWGASGMAWAMVGVMVGLYIPGWAILVRPTCGAIFSSYCRQVFIPTICALLAGLVAWSLANNFSAQWLRLGVGFVSGTLSYALISWFFNRAAVDMVFILLYRRRYIL